MDKIKDLIPAYELIVNRVYKVNKVSKEGLLYLPYLLNIPILFNSAHLSLSRSPLSPVL